MKDPKIAIDSPLGKHSPYISTYTPSLLFPIPRKLSRDPAGIRSPLPFFGTDIWTAYEVSWLNEKGKPEVAVADFSFAADSANLIESKSFKLYLNSFNQSRFGSHADVRSIIEKDLTAASEGKTEVQLTLPSRFNELKIEPFPGICIDLLDTEIKAYEPDPSTLQSDKNKIVTESLYSRLLKSNCPVTGQPDWADILFRYEGPEIDKSGLLRYIVSFRNHRGFHEQCVEIMFCDILERCTPEKLTVYARYTRRGGLDINPFRSNFEKAPENIRSARQ